MSTYLALVRCHARQVLLFVGSGCLLKIKLGVKAYELSRVVFDLAFQLSIFAVVIRVLLICMSHLYTTLCALHLPLFQQLHLYLLGSLASRFRALVFVPSRGLTAPGG